MKLREKICEPFGGLSNNTANELEKIADEYAIEFAEWVEKLPPDRKVSAWSKSGEFRGLFTMDNEQLLQLFKKEKGL